MKYIVRYVSKGTVYVTDGVNNYRVDGEGLFNYDNSGVDYVLYKDSMRSESSCGVDKKLTGKIVNDIINAIIAHFNEGKMKIDIV